MTTTHSTNRYRLPVPTCEVCDADIDPNDYDDPPPAFCRTCAAIRSIAEIVCSNGHCWVPGSPVLNSAGDWGGGVLPYDFCPVCQDTADSRGWHVYHGGETT